MRIGIGVFFLLFVAGVAFSQVRIVGDTLYSAKFSNEKLSTILNDFERESKYSIYYKTDWTDSLLVSIDITNVSIDSLFRGLLKSTQLDYTIWKRAVIITYNAPIITEVEFFKEGASKPSVKDYAFRREVVDEYDEGDIRRVIEIGKRSMLYAGGNAKITGKIVERGTGNALEGVQIFVSDPFIGTTTDASGQFILTLPRGNHKLNFRSVGYKNTYRNIALYSDGTLNMVLAEDVTMLDEVTISAKADARIRETQLGIERITINDMKGVPVTFGERDLVKMALAMPGIQSGGEGSAGIYVRGGKSDQNLILLNDIPIYNTSHFLGFFSSFNPDAISSMDIYKGTLPVKYGGRLSSVFDVRSTTPSFTKIEGEGGIGIVSSRMSLQIPVVKDKVSVLMAGRGTYSGWVQRRIPDVTYRENDIAFSDYLLAVDYKLTERDYFKITGYYSQDRFNLTLDSLLKYYNLGFSGAWNRVINNQLSRTLKMAHSKYGYNVSYNRVNELGFDFDFSVVESSIGILFDDVRLTNFKLMYGGEIKRYGISPGRISTNSESIVNPDEVVMESGLENAAFMSGNYDLTSQIEVSVGLRYSHYLSFGPRDLYLYAPNQPREESTIIGTKSYRNGESMGSYHGPEFRFSGRYIVGPATSVKAGYGRTRQYIHMMSNTNSISPIDIWKLSDPYILPEIADQWTVGVFRNITRYGLEASVEFYMKKIQNSIDYKNGANLLLNENIETELLQGNAKSHGAEFSLKRDYGRIHGFINYTYSRSFQQTSGKFAQETINSGKYYRSNFDRPHDLNVNLNYKFTRRYSVTLNTIYTSGRPITIPVAKYDYGNAEVIHFSDRNAYRIPDYFRIDVGVNIEGNHKRNKLAHSFWTFSVYNVTANDNIYSVFYKNTSGEMKGYKLSVFPKPIPSISYNFKF
jgi:outer membrane cobalamin receptor